MLAQQNRRNYEENLRNKGGTAGGKNGDNDGKILACSVSLDRSCHSFTYCQTGKDKLIQGSSELAKLEEGVHLESEHSWLQKYPGQVTLNIRIPEDIERNAKLTGQLMKIMFAPINTIQQIKAIISEKIGKARVVVGFDSVFNGCLFLCLYVCRSRLGIVEPQIHALQAAQERKDDCLLQPVQRSITRTQLEVI